MAPKSKRKLPPLEGVRAASMKGSSAMTDVSAPSTIDLDAIKRRHKADDAYYRGQSADYRTPSAHFDRAALLAHFTAEKATPAAGEVTVDEVAEVMYRLQPFHDQDGKPFPWETLKREYPVTAGNWLNRATGLMQWPAFTIARR